MNFHNQGNLLKKILTVQSLLLIRFFDHCSVTITPKNPGLVYASIQHCKVKYNNYEMPLMVGSSGESGTYNLKPVCVFGTEIPNSSNMQTLDFSWTAFKWSSAASDSFTENQKVECTVKLTKDQPAHTTANCDGRFFIFLNRFLSKYLRAINSCTTNGSTNHSRSRTTISASNMQRS